MATMLPTHRKQHISALNSDRETLHHPLSPHTSPDEASMKRAAAGSSNIDNYDDDIDNDESVLRYSHPLSPHATSREDDQAQCINDHNSHVESTANVTVAPHPLSPHTTSLDDHPDKSRSHSTVSTTTDEIVSDPRLTPGSSSFSMNGSTRAAISNSVSAAATSHANGSSSKKTILLINGPNLNLLGYREPQIYGSTTLADITSNLTELAASQGIVLQHFQSNHEGQILDRIHACLLGTRPPVTQSSGEYHNDLTNHAHSREVLGDTDGNSQTPFSKPDAIIINPGAFTHTSVALRDALLGISTPFIEVHISNVHAREEFRHKSYLSDKAEAVIAGLGVHGYEAALTYWARKWSSPK